MERTNMSEIPAPSVDSPRVTVYDVIVGRGEVQWSGYPCKPVYGPHAGKELPAGWVLPGGLRTQDKAHAQRVAAAIDRRMRA